MYQDERSSSNKLVDCINDLQCMLMTLYSTFCRHCAQCAVLTRLLSWADTWQTWAPLRIYV